MNSRKQKDLNDGYAEESRVKPILEEYFKCNLTKTGKYCRVDFIDKYNMINIELKKRNVRKNQYPTTMMPLKKLKFMRKQEGYTNIFVFSFTDGIYYCYLDKNLKYSVRTGGRSDRGLAEYNNYAYISVDDLIKVETQLKRV